MDRKHIAETVSRRDADAEPPWMADICSCNICISYIHAGRFTACLSEVLPVHVGCKHGFQAHTLAPRHELCVTAML